MATPDQNAAEKIGRSIDGQIATLNREKDGLLNAAARILEIDAEIAVLNAEKARIASRRPPRGPGPIVNTPPDR